MLTSPNAVAWFAGGIVIYLVLGFVTAHCVCGRLHDRAEDMRRP